MTRSCSNSRLPDRSIYKEKVTGTRADRKELNRLLKAIGSGDQLVVTRIDRLARSVFDLFTIVKRVLDAGGHFLSLSQPMADSTTSTGRLFLAILGGVADVEREMILTRTAEGRARSTKRMGRPPKLTPAQRAEASLERRIASHIPPSPGRSM